MVDRIGFIHTVGFMVEAFRAPHAAAASGRGLLSHPRREPAAGSAARPAQGGRLPEGHRTGSRRGGRWRRSDRHDLLVDLAGGRYRPPGPGSTGPQDRRSDGCRGRRRRPADRPPVHGEQHGRAERGADPFPCLRPAPRGVDHAHAAGSGLCGPDERRSRGARPSDPGGGRRRCGFVSTCSCSRRLRWPICATTSRPSSLSRSLPALRC